MMSVEDMRPGVMLSELLCGEFVTRFDGFRLAGISTDSRKVKPGNVFFALAPTPHQCLEHIDNAMEAGAQVAFSRYPLDVADSQKVEYREDIYGLLGKMAHEFFGRPSEKMPVIGVTGTNGKTSISHFLAHALSKEADQECAIIGTLGTGTLGALKPSLLTTPDTLEIHELLDCFTRSRMANTVMEVSSHALAQQRLTGVRFDTAIFSNLSRDHLDYHHTMENYAAEKSKLFLTPALRAACINRDDPWGLKFIDLVRDDVELFTYSLSDYGQVSGSRTVTPVSGRILAARPNSLTLRVETPSSEAVFSSPVVGRFNAYNMLATICVLLSKGLSLEAATKSLVDLTLVPGRMESFGGTDTTPLVVVDYSHTPASLEAALGALGDHASGQIWCVFGCGGDRDRGKRPQMASVAAVGAQHIVITDDNPRNESGDRIVADICAGLPTRERVNVIRDREQAIQFAVNSACPGDVVLVAGKGHETYQECVGVRRVFSDAAVVRLALRQRIS